MGPFRVATRKESEATFLQLPSSHRRYSDYLLRNHLIKQTRFVVIKHYGRVVLMNGLQYSENALFNDCGANIRTFAIFLKAKQFLTHFKGV